MKTRKKRSIESYRAAAKKAWRTKKKMKRGQTYLPALFNITGRSIDLVPKITWK